ncbi:hypothetical protein Tco_1369359, partial [Tanacetum coccineum]
EGILDNGGCLATLNSRELKKRTEGTKEETSDGLYVRGMSDHSGKAHYGGSSQFKSRGGIGHIDQDSDSSDDEGNAYFGEALTVVGNDEMTELVMDSGGSYHMTHRRDFLYDFKGFDGGSIQLVGFKQLGHKQVGIKQLGPGVETGVHGVNVDKRVWFKVELQGAQGDREAEEQEMIHLGIKVRAKIMVTEVHVQEGAEGNVDEKKKVKESIEVNIGKLLKYNAWSTRWSSVRGSSARKRC